MFLSTYAVRFTNVLLVITLFDTYVEWYQNSPIIASSVQLACHLFYDLCPILIILRRHNQTFSKEEKQTTDVLNIGSRETWINLPEDTTRW